eukprot:UN0653
MGSPDDCAGADTGDERHPRGHDNEGCRWRAEGSRHHLRPHYHLHTAAVLVWWLATRLCLHISATSCSGNLPPREPPPDGRRQNANRLTCPVLLTGAPAPFQRLHGNVAP